MANVKFLLREASLVVIVLVIFYMFVVRPWQVGNAHEGTSERDGHLSRTNQAGRNITTSAAHFNGCCLPNAIVIGAKKAGTRAIMSYLSMHPEVVAANGEPHFFDNSYHRGLKWYAKQITLDPKKPNVKIYTEKSPRYFISGHAPKRIHRFNSSILLILVVRNPVKRVLSDYTQLLSKDSSLAPLGVKLFKTRNYNSTGAKIQPSSTVLQPSFYAKYLKMWYRSFSKEQILIVDGDKLALENPSHVMTLVEEFLHLTPYLSEDRFVFVKEKGFYCKVVEGEIKCAGDSKGRPHPNFDPFVVDRLYDFFEPYNKEFFQLVGRTFDWDKKQ